MSTIRTSLAALVVITGVSASPHVAAQGIPTFDAAGLSQQILDEIEQAQQQLLLIEQLQQQASELNIEIANATSLGDLGLMFDLRSLLNDVIYSDAGATIFSSIYGLDPSSPFYAQEATNILRQDYNLPTDNAEFNALLDQSFNEQDRHKASRLVTRNTRDVELLGQSHERLARTRDISTAYKDAIDQQAMAIDSVPKEKMQAAIQEGGKATLLVASVNQSQLDLAVLQTELALAEEQRRLEQENDAAERRHQLLQAKQAKRNQTYSNINAWNLVHE